MNVQIETLLSEAENRYLNPEELGALNQYVGSLPERLETYRHLREHELDVMQQVADQLQAQFSQEKIEILERSLKNALLAMRTCAMSMLLNDPSFIEQRLSDWLNQMTKAYNTQAIDRELYRLVVQQLQQLLSPKQMSLLAPHLQRIHTLHNSSDSRHPQEARVS